MRIVVLSVVALLWESVAWADPKKVDVEVIWGIDKIAKFDFVPSTKVLVGNRSIIDYILIPQKREIIFRGLKAGATSLTLRNTAGDSKIEYKVTVIANDLSKIVRELKEFLGDIEGIEIGIKGNRVYVGGHIIVPGDAGRVVAILVNYPDVINLLELSPQTQLIIAKKMQQEIQKAGQGLKDVTVRVVNNSYWLEGVVPSAADKTSAQRVALAYLPDNILSLAKRTDAVQSVRRDMIQNLIAVHAKKKPKPKPKLIKISAQFVELTKDYNRIFGFKWDPLLSEGQGSISFGKSVGGGVTTKSSNSFSGTISNLFPKLSSAKAAGYAREMQSGSIIVKNKQPAEISKTISKPFAIGTGEFTQAKEASSGFTLNITPTIMPKENIDLDISLGVRATVGSPPETIGNKIKTKLVVKSKHTAVAGGISLSKTSTDFDRTPPGGITQVEGGRPLFSFIRSKAYVRNKSQFVVFVTPEIVPNATQETEIIKHKFRKRGR